MKLFKNPFKKIPNNSNLALLDSILNQYKSQIGNDQNHTDNPFPIFKL